MSSSVKHFSLQGVKCAGCVRSLEKALSESAVINNFSVNFAERTLAVETDNSAEQVEQVVSDAGYGATPLETAQDQLLSDQRSEQEYLALRTKSMISLAAGGLLMALGMAGLMPDLQLVFGRFYAASVGIVSLLIMYFCAGNIYNAALQNLTKLRFNMDALVALGTGSAWLYSTGLLMVAFIDSSQLFANSHLYYEATVMILGFILLGQSLEHKARSRTAGAVKALLNLQPEQAWRWNGDEYVQVPVALLLPEDRIRIKPGERIAIDGEIVQGESYIDESMITGEPVPVLKVVGDSVVGGTLNTNGMLDLLVTNTGDKTVLAQIISTVRQAQNSKPALGRLADDVAAYFVPAVIAIALFAAALWWFVGPEPQLGYATVILMTVLIIACPCALGLATPMSVMVGVGRAAQSGILIRNGDALQRAGEVNIVVVDKTGTLTQGSPTVVDHLFQHNGSEFRAELASVAHASEHPLSQALNQFLDVKEYRDLTEFESVSGMGVKAICAGSELLLGSRKWLEQNRIDCSAFSEAQTQFSNQHCSLVWAAVSGKAVALFALNDPLREGVKEAVAQLQDDGMQVVMLSGDIKQTAEAVAKELKIDQVVAEVKPEQKLEVIKQYQQQGNVVAMVGDGINDAPALAQADVGFAVSSGTDIAMESADVVLMSGHLDSVANAIKLSSATVKNIKQNLFGAFIYNSLAIPVAAGVLYPLMGLLLSPVIAGAAMAASSVTVVSNANRLRWLKLK